MTLEEGFLREFTDALAFKFEMERDALWIDMLLGPGAGDEARRQATATGQEIGRTTPTSEREAIRATMRRFLETVMATGSGWVSCGPKPLTAQDLGGFTGEPRRRPPGAWEFNMRRRGGYNSVRNEPALTSGDCWVCGRPVVEYAKTQPKSHHVSPIPDPKPVHLHCAASQRLGWKPSGKVVP